MLETPRRIIMGALALCLACVIPMSAHAQQTLSKFEAIKLPDGRDGLMAILRNDGILFADRLQLVVLDGERRLLAQSAESFGHALVCDRKRFSCHGYDHDRDLVVSLDPSGFRADGPIVPNVKNFENLSVFPRGDWGFTVRPATAGEWLEAEWAEIRTSWQGFGLLAFVGALCAAIGSHGLGPWKRASFWRVAAWIFSIAARLIAVALFLLFALYFCMLSGSCGTFFSIGISVGVAAYWLVRLAVRGRRLAPA